jgi:hypothetical protein
MTGLEFFASIGLPALLVLFSYAAVVWYERTNRVDADNSKGACGKPDPKPV